MVNDIKVMDKTTISMVKAIKTMATTVKDMVKVKVINVNKETSAIDKTNKPSCFSEDLWAMQLANDQI